MKERKSDIPKGQAVVEEVTSAPLTTALQPRTAAEMRLLAAELTDLSIAALEAIVRNPEAKDSDIIAAARELLDRAHGKIAPPEDTRDIRGDIHLHYHEAADKLPVIFDIDSTVKQ